MFSNNLKKDKAKINEPVIVVLSDWDNTMMPSAELLYQVHKLTADELQKNNNINLLTEIPRIATKPRDAILIGLFGKDNLAKVKSVFERHYNIFFSPESLQKMKMFRGARSLLTELPSADIYMGIISSHYAYGNFSKQDGIHDHLVRNNIDASDIMIIGTDTLSKHGYDSAQHAKPKITSGLLAFKLWGIDPAKQTIKVLMLGDGKSDLQFATNMHKYLNNLNPHSSCTGILFNALPDDKSIFTKCDLTKLFIDIDPEKYTYPHIRSQYTVMGFCRFFTKVRDMRAPHLITNDMLITQKSKLKKI